MSGEELDRICVDLAKATGADALFLFHASGGEVRYSVFGPWNGRGLAILLRDLADRAEAAGPLPSEN